jgi:hypothetical protein
MGAGGMVMPLDCLAEGLRSPVPRRRGALAVLGVSSLWLALPACVTVELPAIAHVHVGHLLTAWADTPGQRGLLEVALQDAAVAAEHAAYATDGATDLDSVLLHLGHVLHAADPRREPTGPGSGYGLIRAIEGSADHLGFAIEVPDASANLRSGGAAVLAGLGPLGRDARTLAALADDARRLREPAQALAYAQEARQRAERLAGQLLQLRQRLQTVLAAESPPYRTVARRFLFGLIRLSSGEWAHGHLSGSNGHADHD